MEGLAFAAVSVMHFVSVKVRRRVFPTGFGAIPNMRDRSPVAVIGMEVVVYMAVEVSGTVKPWASTDEDTAGEPLRTVISVGGAAIGWGFIVAVGAVGGDSDVDVYLSLGRLRRGSEERKTSYCS